MENLTMLQKVIRPCAGLDPLEGYVLVVYEQLGESGAEFRGILRPGTRFQERMAELARWLGLHPPQSYFAIAVNLAPELRFTLNEHFTLDDQIHSFDVGFDLAYCVTEPEAIATARYEDPLRQLRDEIIHIIGRLIAQSQRDEIRRHFRDLEQNMVDRAWYELYGYAANLGFGLKAIALRARLLEKEIEVDVLHLGLGVSGPAGHASVANAQNRPGETPSVQQSRLLTKFANYEVERSNKQTTLSLSESRIAFYLLVSAIAGFILLRILTDQEIVIALGTFNIAIIGMWIWVFLSKIRLLTQSLKYNQQNEP